MLDIPENNTSMNKKVLKIKSELFGFACVLKGVLLKKHNRGYWSDLNKSANSGDF